MWNSVLSGAACLRRSARRLGFVLEVLQQAGPAAVHVLAHGGARFRAQPLELAMFQLHRGASVPCATNLTSTPGLTLVSRLHLPLRSQLVTKRSGGSPH